MTTETPQRDDTKHEYKIVPIVDGSHCYNRQVIVGQWKSEVTGEAKSIFAALDMLDAHSEVQRVHVYHSHPSPGPQGRYMGAVLRATRTLHRPI